MRKYLIILLLIPAYLQALTTATIIIKDGATGDDYATFALAEAAFDNDLVSGDSAMVYEGQGAFAAAAATTTFDGATTDATRNITIKTTGSARHSGTLDLTNAHRFQATYQPLVISDDNVILDGLQINMGATAGTYRYGINFTSAAGTIKNCIMFYENTAASGAWGIYTHGATSTIFNNIVYSDGSSLGVGIYVSGNSGGHLVYNNTVVDFDTSFGGQPLDGDFRNNMTYNDTYFMLGQPDADSDHNANDAASITYPSCGGCGANDVLSITDPFVSRAGDNYLLSAADADGAEDGEALSGTLTDDIIGTARPQSTNWDIGANEFIVAAGGFQSSRRRKVLLGR